MASTWIYVMCIMLFGSYILQLVPLMFYLSVVLIVNCGVLAASYFLFRRDPLLNMRENMLFMLGLTVINILTDLGIMSYFMSWVLWCASALVTSRRRKRRLRGKALRMPYVSNTVRYFLGGEELPVKQRCLQMPALTMKTKEFRINMCQIGKIILICLPFIRMDRFCFIIR